MTPKNEPNPRSGLLGDLKDPRLMYLKAALFLFIGLLCAGALFVQNPTLLTGVLLLIGIWSFCRLYYFFFYVIEKYIDSSYKFAGLHSAVIYLFSHRRGKKDNSATLSPSGSQNDDPSASK